ncbi:NAD-dependent epimerase/dehydratase family protein [Thermodesulfovibrio sp. 3907-1M]|uniref:NAD-dependent epimerase/dehydratase family protein n=1 Tax=Thermodesulfovibrio autotrophicus TaxID=3118333 RepID=A0AAU8GTS4_9BACT
MKKLLITGGTGFIGRYVVKLALQRSYDVHLIVRNPEKAKALFGEKPKIYQLNEFTNREKLRKIIEIINPQYVIHLIGIIQEKGKATFEKVHYQYSKALYEALKDFPVEKIIHMSALGVDEKAPSNYHITKLKAEKELIKTGIPFVILRPSFVVGPEQLLFLKLKPVLKRLPILIFPDIGKYYFQPVDVRDVAECFINAIDYNGNAIFELCGDEKVTLRNIVHDFAKNLGKNAIFVPFPKTVLKIFARQQYKMMWRDNVCGYSEVLQMETLLKKKSIPYREQIKWAAQH